MSAPDETEIRAVIGEQWTRTRAERLSLADTFSDAWGAAAEATDGLWDLDAFRPAELERFDALRSAALSRVEWEAEAALLEALLAALVAFAAEHPDAPRHVP